MWTNCTYVNVSVVGKSSESLVQGLVHLLSIAFEETSTAYDAVSTRIVGVDQAKPYRQ
jgi:hypothetical protein